MYTLYYSPGAASLAVHWMLVELGVSFELELVDIKSERIKSAEYRRLNPSGQVPTLVVDGEPCTESAALLMLLAERHPDAGFAPAVGSAGRAAYLELMIYLANGLLPAFRNWFYVGDYAGSEHEADVLDHARSRIEAVFDRLDHRLADGRSHLLGEALTAPDFLATMLMRWSRSMPRPATAWPHLAAYAARMKARPSYAQVSAREPLSEWIG
jgi:glutathione S-transferase